MVIVPHMAGHDANAQNVFNGLYTYARAHPSQGNPQLMDSTPRGTAAPLMVRHCHGLLVADAQWGSNGSINYRQEALNIIEASTIGPTSNLPMLGDWEFKQVDLSGHFPGEKTG